MHSSRLTSASTLPRSSRSSDPADPVESPGRSRSLADTDSLRRRTQSPRFHRIQLLVDEEPRSASPGSPLSSLASPLSPRRTPRKFSQDSRDSSPEPPTYRDVITGSPDISSISEFDFPKVKTKPNSKVQLFRKTEVYEIETEEMKNGDLNSNFPEGSMRKCPGGDHDHRLCRQQLDDIHAQLQAMMAGTLTENVDNHVVDGSSVNQYQENSSQYHDSLHSQSTTVHSTVEVNQQVHNQRVYNLQFNNQQTHNQQLNNEVVQSQEFFSQQSTPPLMTTTTTTTTSVVTNESKNVDQPKPSGPCTCCPYGYHIDLTFLGIFDEVHDNSILDKLLEIRWRKKQLRKSMEIRLRQHENGDEIQYGDSLITELEEDEEATRAMLQEIDCSVDATIASIDHLIQDGRKPRKFSLPELDETDVSLGSGPQNTSSPKPNGGLRRRIDSNDSLSSLDTSTSDNVKTDVSRRTDVNNVTSIISLTSHQIAVNMANCFDGMHNDTENRVSVTPDQLHKMREQIALSLQRMKELEEQVKAIPVLQVRISVLKEEKRLLALQNEAKTKRMSKSFRSIGVGDQTIDEPERPSRSRSQSPGFEMSEFASIRRGRRTPLPSERVDTEEMGVGDGDVRNLYYLRPELISQEEFIETARVLLPEHIKVEVNDEPEVNLFRRSEFELPDEIDAGDLDEEFDRVEKALEAQTTERFFASPGDRLVKQEEISDSDESVTTVTTTKTTKILETSGYPRGEVIRVPEIIRPPKPITRDFGQTFNEAKPKLVDVSIGVGETNEESEESDYDEYGRKIVTTTTVTRSNMLLQEERVKRALREALHRNVKSVGINVRFATCDQETLTEFIETKEVGCSNDTIDVTVKPNAWLRSIGTEVKPSVNNHATWTDKLLKNDSGTNTPEVIQKTKNTNTNKVLTFPAACNTEAPSTYSVGIETDHKTLYALNLINNTGVNTQGLCTCGPDPLDEYELISDDTTEEGTDSTRVVRRRVVSYETSPITVSVNREVTSTTRNLGQRTYALSDTETDYDNDRDDKERLDRLELEKAKLTTYERHFPVQPTRPTQRFVPSSSRTRVSGPAGDTLLVRRVKSYGHSLPNYGVPRDPHYADHTNLGTYLSTVSTSQTLDIGPRSDVHSTEITGNTKTVNAQGFSSEFPRPVVIERTSTSTTSTASEPFVDVVETHIEAPVVQSQSDIFGNETSSTIVRKSKETSSTTTSSTSVDDSESSSKKISRRAQLDGASMLSGSDEYAQPVALHRTRGRLNLTSNTDIPLARKLGSTNLTGGTVTSSMTSSVSTITSSKSLGEGGEIIENISAENEFTSSDPTATKPDMDLTSDMDILSKESLFKSMEASGLQFPQSSIDSQSIEGKLSFWSGGSMDSSSGVGGVREYSSSREVRSVNGKGTVREETMKKVDGEVLEHDVKTDTFSGAGGASLTPIAPITNASIVPESGTSVRFFSTPGSAARGDNVTVTSSMTSSVSTYSSSKTIGPDGEVIEKISADNEFNSSDPNAEKPDIDVKSEIDKLSLESGFEGMTVSPVRSSLNFRIGEAQKISGSQSGVKEYTTKKEVHSIGGQGTVKEETMKKLDGEIVEHEIKTDSFSGQRSPTIVKPVARPMANVRFLRSKLSEKSDSQDDSYVRSKKLEASNIPTLSSEKTLDDFKQESANLKSRQLKTEAVLGDTSESLLISNRHTSKGDSLTVQSTSTGKTSPKPKSIMKKGGKKERGEKKAIKFAAGTVGGFVSASESDSDSDTSDTSSGSESSFDEGSYDGREGRITYSCKDDMSRATDPARISSSAESQSREVFELSATVRTMCETVNDHLLKKKDIPTEIWNESLSSLQSDWFRVSGQKLTNPRHVEAYIAALRSYSHELLEKIVNLVDANGNTCLHYSVSYCNFETLAILVNSGVCDVNKTNRLGYTPIMLASLAQVQMDRQKEILRYLFRAGNVNMKASQAGQTALMLAASHGKKEIVKLLLDCGADINAMDDDGSTALMCACEHGHADIVKILLAQPECNATLVDKDGSTALSIAMDRDHRDIAVLLYAKLGIKKSGSPIP